MSREEQGAALGINGSLMALSQGIVPLIAGAGSSVVGLTIPFLVGSGTVMWAWSIVRRLDPSKYVMQGTSADEMVPPGH